MRTKIFLTLVLLCGISFADVSETIDQSPKMYPFIFRETTGDNRFTLVDGKIVPIKAFSGKSDPESLSALRSLKPNILYQNGGGNKIFLIGIFLDDGSFLLKNWFIVSPFFSYDIINEEELPQQSKLTKRSKLQALDFSKHVPNMERHVKNLE